MAPSTTEVTIKIRAFPYYETVTDPVTQQEVRQERIARRGDTVQLEQGDYERAVRFDAVQGEVDADIQEVTGAFSLEQATPEEVADYLRGEKPSVKSLVEAVDGDPVLAQKVIDAENLATGQQPRSSLVDALTPVAAGTSD